MEVYLLCLTLTQKSIARHPSPAAYSIYALYSPAANEVRTLYVYHLRI